MQAARAQNVGRDCRFADRSLVFRGTRLVAREEVATVVDFVLAYTLDWADIEDLLEDFPVLKAYMEKMYRRPNATPRIEVASAAS